VYFGKEPKAFRRHQAAILFRQPKARRPVLHPGNIDAPQRGRAGESRAICITAELLSPFRFWPAFVSPYRCCALHRDGTAPPPGSVRSK
jgi:hypothetical protein